jgi:prepilin-type N-terminal cleavage/methylation domain-containing protein
MRLRRYAAAAGRRLASERGYSLSEMLVVLAIIGIVLGALTQLFVSASTAQVDMTRRFEAQQDMRVALDKLRREIHCANKVTGSPPTSSIVISLGSYCPTNGTGADVDVTWCTNGSGSRFALMRYVGTATAGCTASGGRKEADYLTTNQVFTAYAAPASGGLGKLSVILPVDLTPSNAQAGYVLKDDIALRNTLRPA